jgi:hypothetical protein
MNGRGNSIGLSFRRVCRLTRAWLRSFAPVGVTTVGTRLVWGRRADTLAHLSMLAAEAEAAGTSNHHTGPHGTQTKTPPSEPPGGASGLAALVERPQSRQIGAVISCGPNLLLVHARDNRCSTLHGRIVMGLGHSGTRAGWPSRQTPLGLRQATATPRGPWLPPAPGSDPEWEPRAKRYTSAPVTRVRTRRRVRGAPEGGGQAPFAGARQGG